MTSARCLTLCRPHRDPDRTLLEQPGAFLWWYVDLLDAAGDGAVLIWSFGLPFLPGLRDALDAGADARPRRWPALSLALYERSRPAFYALVRYSPNDAAWPTEGLWRLGRTLIRRRREGTRLRLEADLVVPLPEGGHAEGRLTLDGVARRASDGEASGEVEHDWSPLVGPAEGAVSLTLPSGASFAAHGRAYHDRNGGRLPLWGLGIGRWLWGRAPLPEAELIYYVPFSAETGEAEGPLVLLVDAAGRTMTPEVAAVALGRERRTWAGACVPSYLEIALSDGRVLRAEAQRLFEHAPFYHRGIIEVTLSGLGGARGVGEGVVPGRLDEAWQRPFVRMRVHDETRPRSLFLPLFSGPRDGRIRRFLRGVLSVQGRPDIA